MDKDRDAYSSLCFDGCLDAVDLLPEPVIGSPSELVDKLCVSHHFDHVIKEPYDC
jgi:hypothetical protein